MQESGKKLISYFCVTCVTASFSRPSLETSSGHCVTPASPRHPCVTFEWLQDAKGDAVTQVTHIY